MRFLSVRSPGLVVSNQGPFDTADILKKSPEVLMLNLLNIVQCLDHALPLHYARCICKKQEVRGEKKQDEVPHDN